jgi:hypothetical protein
MKTASVEEPGHGQPATPPQTPKPPQQATTAASKGHVAASKAKSARRPHAAKKGAKVQRKAGNPRPGSKTAKILNLLRRPGGATLQELRKATSWQPHSVRGFLSLLGKKKGLAVKSTKAPDGERTYSVKA